MTEAPRTVYEQYPGQFDEILGPADDALVSGAIHQAALDRIAALEREKATGWAVLRDATAEMAKRAAYWSQKATEEAAEHGNDFETARAVTKCATYSSVEAFLKSAAEADHIARVTACLIPADQSAIDAAKTEAWDEGCDTAMIALCTVVGADPAKVNWDAATETVEGDVASVIGNILTAGLGELWNDQQSAIDALVKAASKIEYDWDGEPEDVVELREALAAIRAQVKGTRELIASEPEWQREHLAAAIRAGGEA